jgi:elongation factor Ts
MTDISIQTIKILRDKTSAGILACQKALEEAKGDMEKATEILRQKGLAMASKKVNRIVTEGIIDCYIHAGGKLGVMIELNCETDFVARRPEFRELAHNIAMQIAASSSVEFVTMLDIPTFIVEKEKTIELSTDDIQFKTVEMRERIAEGRLQKRLKELCLVDQPFIRDSSITIDTLIKQNIAILGENIQIRRFKRFVLGEGIEK